MRFLGRHSEQSALPTGFAVVDMETTGLHPGYHHRVVEIAIVDLDLGAQPQAEWSTLLNPERDVGPTRIHGIRAEDVAGAPRFADVAGEVVQRIAGRVLVAHNLRFDLGFLDAELRRVDAELGVTGGICTLGLASRFGIVGPRNLSACCESFGIAHEDAHVALSDAEATARLLSAYLTMAGAAGLGRAEYVRDVPWPPFPPSLQPAARGARPAVAPTTLSTFVASLPPGPELNVVDQVAAVEYLAVLDRALEDRTITDEELLALGHLAIEWGLDQKDVAAIHWSYLEGLRRAAWADGRLTEDERRDLLRVGELLAVNPTVADAAASPLPAYDPFAADTTPATDTTSAGPLNGLTVCFTGESICSVRGRHLTRADQMRFAAEAGANVVDSLTKKVDMLVLADPASQSGKSRKAAEYGVRRIAEPVFWRMAGIRTD
ncbi:MAG TPA: exonuclease domain-containing protein [Candidatus Limnocylindria bacterium]|nr:exonuclease domain-containing protein [Candidatus Limnocylindria bacterium]